MKQTQININLDKLNKLTKACKNTYARVGVLAGGNLRKEKDHITNYELAIIHEFGSPKSNIPARSFLKMPIETKKKDVMTIAERNVDLLLNTQDVIGFFKKLGVEGQRIIQLAFDTGGFGKWAKNKPSTIAAKGSDSPLVDTSALRKSISWDIKEK